MHRHSNRFIRTGAAALLLCLGLTAAAESSPMVVVVERDGSTYEMAMPTMDRITFAGDGLMMKGAEGNKWFDYSQIDRILIGAPPTSVGTPGSEGRLMVWPSPATDVINVAGLPDGAEVSLFTTSGSAVASAVSADGRATLDVSAAPAGTLIVTSDGLSVKIIKN